MQYIRHHQLIANTIAWVIAVLFAYIINDLWVFQSKSSSKGNQVKKFSKFFSARIVTFLFEQAGMLLFIDILGFNNLIIKAFIAVVVTILTIFLVKCLYLYKMNNKKVVVRCRKTKSIFVFLIII